MVLPGFPNERARARTPLETSEGERGSASNSSLPDGLALAGRLMETRCAPMTHSPVHGAGGSRGAAAEGALMAAAYRVQTDEPKLL